MQARLTDLRELTAREITGFDCIGNTKCMKFSPAPVYASHSFHCPQPLLEAPWAETGPETDNGKHMKWNTLTHWYPFSGNYQIPSIQICVNLSTLQKYSNELELDWKSDGFTHFSSMQYAYWGNRCILIWDKIWWMNNVNKSSEFYISFTLRYNLFFWMDQYSKKVSAVYSAAIQYIILKINTNEFSIAFHIISKHESDSM